MEILNSEIVRKNNSLYTVLTVTSDKPDKTYRVDVTNKRCSCPAWIFAKVRKPCKHLNRMGVF